MQLVQKIRLHGCGGGVRLLQVCATHAHCRTGPTAQRTAHLTCRPPCASLPGLSHHAFACRAPSFMQALLQRFFKYADQHSLSLPERRPFTLKYDTTIPRASGLAGSSAIMGAALECLLDYYDMRGK